VIIIRDNPRVHSLADLANFFVSGYWPREDGGALYRPLTILGFALQWAAGGGRPLLFHLANVALYLGLTLAVYALARACLPLAAAWSAAALFAVHPVHVEAAGNVVGQSELTTGLCLCLGVLLYLRARRRATLRARESVGLFLLTVVAGLFKEQGILLPVLLGAAELTVVRDPRPARERARVLAPTAALLLLAQAAVLMTRRSALGVLVGEYPIIAVGGLGFGDRVLTMLGIAPEWYRLLFWPAHLQADYGPPGTDAATAFGLRQGVGLALLTATAALAAAAWRRHRALAFGIAWAAVTIFPVSNLLVPTGILVAERTLLSPSIGALLAVGGLVDAVGLALPHARGRLRQAAVAALVAVLGMGAVRSALRQPVWRDNPTAIRQAVRDAPLSYRTWYAYGWLLRGEGQPGEAWSALQRAERMYQRDPAVYEALGQFEHGQRGCRGAIPYFERALAIDSTRYFARGRLYVCLLNQGDSARALDVAARGAAMGQLYFQLVTVRARGQAGLGAPASR
jgi:tetratricopeptide (TPR) repeat protein